MYERYEQTIRQALIASGLEPFEGDVRRGLEVIIGDDGTRDQDASGAVDPFLFPEGNPLEISLAFDDQQNRLFRYVYEPCIHLPRQLRLGACLDRLRAFVREMLSGEERGAFEKALAVFVSEPPPKDAPCPVFCIVGCQVAAVQRPQVRIYFVECDGGNTMSRVEHVLTKVKILKLMKALDLEEEIEYFNDAYRILLGDGELDQNPRFVTFVGLDLARGKRPKLKVYFSPHFPR